MRHPVFTAEHDELRDAVRRFVDKEISPNVDEWEDAGLFPARRSTALPIDLRGSRRLAAGDQMELGLPALRRARRPRSPSTTWSYRTPISSDSSPAKASRS